MELSHVSLRNGLGIARDTLNYNAIYLPRDNSTTTLPRKTERTSRVNLLVHIVLLSRSSPLPSVSLNAKT